MLRVVLVYQERMTEVRDLAKKIRIRSVLGLYRSVRGLLQLPFTWVRVLAMGRAYFHLRVANQPSMLTLHEYLL